MCAFAERERGCKRKYDESSRVLLSRLFQPTRTRLLFHIFFPQKSFFVWLFHKPLRLPFAQSGHVPLRSESDATNKFQREKSVSSGNSSTQTPLKRVCFSLSLYRIEPKAKKEEGTERALSLSRWRRLLCSPSPPLPRSSGVHPSRDAEEEEEEEARRRGRRLLHRMRRRGTTRTSTRRRKRYPPPTNARINRVKVKCGGQTLPLLLLLR